MGPMIAAARFLRDLKKQTDQSETTRLPERITCSLHGSLAFTGKGHSTDRAVILGLIGCQPDTLDPDDAERLEAEIYSNKCIEPHDLPKLSFDPNSDLIFDYANRANGFPWLCLRKGSPMPLLPPPNGNSSLSMIEETDPEDWLERPEDTSLTVQTLRYCHVNRHRASF